MKDQKIEKKVDRIVGDEKKICLLPSFIFTKY